MSELELLGKNAKKAAEKLLSATESLIDRALLLAARLLRENSEMLKARNAEDVSNAEKKGKSAAFIDRLKLTDKVISGMAEGIEQVASLKSPVGKEIYTYFNKEQDIKISKKNVPFGVIGIIFESRPNVTADAFALCLKTGNSVILRGGSDSLISNKAIVSLLRRALKECGIDENAVSLIEDTSHETAEKFMKLDKYVDLIIPRGGASLIKTAVENSTVPIIETGVGNCHVYIDEFADGKKSAEVVFNAKTQRYSVCNACESLVVHSAVLNSILPLIAERLGERNVEMRCDDRAYEAIKGYPYLAHASEEDFFTEYGDAVISVKTVDSLQEAVDHINVHGTRHSESIMTEDAHRAEKFMSEIDTAVVYHNASTRFSDGFVFGLGAEIGISTQKLHARGPMGLDALVTTKYFVTGDGAVRK